MPSPSETVTFDCAVCGQSMNPACPECPVCHASADWQDLLRAMAFAQAQFEEWAHRGMLDRECLGWITQADQAVQDGYRLAARQGQAIPGNTGLSPRNRCWSCGQVSPNPTSHCPDCGVPLKGDLVQRLRYLTFTAGGVKSHYEVRRLSLAAAHACSNDAKGRIKAIRSQLEELRDPILAVLVEDQNAPVIAPIAAVAPPTDKQSDERTERPSMETGSPSPSSSASFRAPPPVQPRTPRRPLLEIILDPRSIQWFLGFGGALLVLGLVIWLATLGIFKNALVVAVCLGAANAVGLAGGWTLAGRTRYQTAGRALTLLACLVMPLNLWFYDSHHLITLDGHLWVAALVCCVLYAASAMILRDAMFVYVLTAGVTMTGMLILAEQGKFWEIAAPASLLVTLGLIGLHLERAFPVADGPFSRRRFGLACFWSGQALLAAGLLLVLGAQVAGDWLYRPVFEPLYRHLNLAQPPIVTERWGQLLALGLVIAGTYAYAYSDLVVRRVGVYLYLAVVTLLWAEVLAIHIFMPAMPAEAAIIALALTAMLVNLAAPAGESVRPLARAARPIGLVLSTLPVLLGIVLYFRAICEPLRTAWPLPGGEGQPYVITWWYVAAMALTALACRVGAYVHRHSAAWLSTSCFFGTAAATLVGAAGFLSLVGVTNWDDSAAILMLLPLAYAVAARLYRGHTPERPLIWTGHAATAIILSAVLAVWANLTPQLIFEPLTGKPQNLMLALIFGEAAVFYALAGVFAMQSGNVYLCTLSLAGAVWQVLLYAGVGPEYYTLTFALAGLFLLVGYRLAAFGRTGLGEPAFHCANALMSLSLAAAALLTLSRMATRLADVHWSLAALLAALAMLSLAAAWLVRDANWRRWYLVMAIVEAALTFLTIHLLSNLNIWEKMEIFSVAVGIGLLIIGHAGWYRERESQDDLVSFSLLAGSLLVAVPLSLAVLVHRGELHFSTLDEFGMLAAAVLLLASGFVLQLRSTALAGAGMMTVYLVTLLLYINMLQSAQKAAIWMTIGGGAIFATGIILSIYRDRLLLLPDQVKRREGVFKVLTWR
jgi:hypothetical protein